MKSVKNEVRNQIWTNARDKISYLLEDRIWQNPQVNHRAFVVIWSEANNYLLTK